MTQLLLIIDMQNGFISDEAQAIVPGIETLIKHFDQNQLPVAFTRFINNPESGYVKWMGWSKLMTQTETSLIANFCDTSARVFDKPGYTAFTAEFELFLTENSISKIVMCGAETDGCVLKTAIDAFEKNYQPIVVIDACASNAGTQFHDAGLLLLSRLIGKRQITTIKNVTAGVINMSTPPIIDLYDKDDLGAAPIFQGGFINFGYWKGIDLDKGKISVAERAQASEALYQMVFDQFSLKDNNKPAIAEIGCGRGLGCGLLCENKKVGSITGVDINDKQIERAKQLNQTLIDANPEKLSFQQGSGANTGLASNHFDVIYSVEASQHFPSTIDFLKEVDRALKPDGKLVITTFFATDTGFDDILKQRFATIESGVDHFRPLDSMKADCREMGFELIHEESIGQEVYYGFDQWMSQLDNKDQEKWVNYLLKSFQEGMIDYTVLTYQRAKS